MSKTPTNFVKIGKYRISRADDRNLQVDEYRLVKAKKGRYVDEARESEKWVCRGYFSGLPSAARGILRYMNEDSVDNADVQTVKELLVAVSDNEKFLVKALREAELKTEDFTK